MWLCLGFLTQGSGETKKHAELECSETAGIELLRREVQSISLGMSFSKAQSSKLERLSCHVSVKRDVRALSFEL